MDDRVAQVLELYHERLQAEREERNAGIHRPNSERFLAVGRRTGQLISILELGTSYGYSTIWLAEAARTAGGRLVTMELEPHKIAYARDMAERAGLADYVDFRHGDALSLIGRMDDGIDFVLMDLWKDLYVPCLEAVLPKLAPGAIIVADNMRVPGGEDARKYQQAVRAIPHMLSVPLPVGTGLEVSRYLPV
ncbi:O-methyltransferase [Gluconobacter oxydans]|uniref:Methyltransferase domain-containing protein n=2 Tax=Gluconobacter oxydans TaxID=442 RepID=A0AB35AK40_GLUOY|nr:class I SAM-dependent methyltransferase [Gluconobacter oxydans]AAW60312.1 Putative O-methyltransferase [Gluconobacter oxydans 621H]KXV30881.1 methyltransferase [Gluconobacter oxydans]MBF0855294.1 methyltransferase domain-containing protein [Gluconobacter oxydans]TCW28813.1 putative O-methyltransferase YrrM [Gluconobacter oxydans]GEC59794.1 putative O-methyltransferase, family 3 [Gluconobacter oxydans]